MTKKVLNLSIEDLLKLKKLLTSEGKRKKKKGKRSKRFPKYNIKQGTNSTQSSSDHMKGNTIILPTPPQNDSRLYSYDRPQIRDISRPIDGMLRIEDSKGRELPKIKFENLDDDVLTRFSNIVEENNRGRELPKIKAENLDNNIISRFSDMESKVNKLYNKKKTSSLFDTNNQDSGYDKDIGDIYNNSSGDFATMNPLFSNNEQNDVNNSPDSLMMSPDSLMLSPLLTTTNLIYHPQIQPNNLRFEKEEPHNNLIPDQEEVNEQKDEQEEEENESTRESSGEEYNYVDEIPEDELIRLNTTYGKKTINLKKEYIIRDYLFLSKTLNQKPNLKLKRNELISSVKELLDEYNNLE
jgi:hypothetical protein